MTMNSTSTASSRQPHFAANLCEGLERLGEFRREWLKNPKYVRATVWGLALLFGFLGVLFGYVLYFQLEPVVHDANLLDARSLVFGVFTAAVLGALSEWIRQVIDDGAERLFPPRRIVLITALTLLLFELFIASAHKIAE